MVDPRSSEHSDELRAWPRISLNKNQPRYRRCSGVAVVLICSCAVKYFPFRAWVFPRVYFLALPLSWKKKSGLRALEARCGATQLHARDLVNADGALIGLCPRQPEGAHSGGEDPGSRSQGSSTMDGSQFGLLTGTRRRCGSFRWTDGGPAFSGPLDECVQLLRSPIVPGRRNRDHGHRFRGRAIANSLALKTGTRSSHWQTQRLIFRVLPSVFGAPPVLGIANSVCLFDSFVGRRPGKLGPELGRSCTVVSGLFVCWVEVAVGRHQNRFRRKD